MTKEARNPKHDIRSRTDDGAKRRATLDLPMVSRSRRISDFELRASFGFRHSDFGFPLAFVIRHSSFSSGNPCWRNASNSTRATQLDKLSDRALGLHIGMRSQWSRFPSSSFLGKPAVSRPKTR